MKKLTSFFALFTALVGPACGPSDMIVSKAGSAPLGAFDTTLASVPMGIVVGFSARVAGAKNVDGVSAAVDDPTIVSLKPTTVSGQYVLIGLSPGRTTLHVRAKGARTADIPVEVSEQPQ
jgi:hypothetical protein